MSRPWCVYSDAYYVDMGEHVFPVEKYRRVYAELSATGVLRPEDIAEPRPASEEDLLLVHDPAYLAHLRRLAAFGWGYLTPDTPVSPDILEGSILSAGGTILAGRLALDRGVSLHLSGGFHHAFGDHGEGFCYVNDVAVAVRRLQADGVIRRAAIIDCDVHQGNGNASIFADDKSVFTFSIHEDDNYPLVKPPSDLDIGLPYRCPDGPYLAGVHRGVEAALGSDPELAFYLAGADPYEGDMLGGLAVTTEGLLERDRIVLRGCAAARVPATVVLAGGYARDTADTVAIHCRTAREVRARLDGSVGVA
ncbi:MAG: histone deacetylase [Armatimonadetes bacterium]|nr:histone deacetylase [Armatimonadota bacterium]